MRLLRSFLARTRAIAALAVGALTWAVFPLDPRVLRAVVSWDAAAATYLAVAMVVMLRSDAERLRAQAIKEDDGAIGILVVTIGACIASVAATFVEVASASAGLAGWQVWLAALTVALSWTLLHTVFALHYAHEFELGREARPTEAWKVSGGLDFPQEEPPDYGDFLYFSFVVGVAAQTADVVVRSRHLRRLVLLHGIVAFWFNASILALAVSAASALF